MNWSPGPVRSGSSTRVHVAPSEVVHTAALEQDDDDEEDELAPELDLTLDPTLDRGTMRLLVTRGQALAFAGRAAELVASGRPACRFCGLPMDPEGHPCPRMN